MNDATGADIVLDTRGLNCPLPLLRARQALNGMHRGQTLKVLATDPSSPADFQLFAERVGLVLLGLSEAGGEYTILLKKT